MKNVLVTGGNFVNQGAYLMLVAAAAGIREHLGAQPVLAARFGSERDKRWLGYETLLAEERFGFFPRLGTGKRMERVRDRLPFVTASEIHAVLDVTGFAFGDQWADAPIMRRAQNYRRWSERGVPVFMLPQAFGPFEQTAEAAKLAMESSQLVFARDPDSDHFARKLLGQSADGRLQTSPDFTGAVPGTMPVGLERFRGMAAIVPNWNVADRTDDGSGRERYLDNLVAAVEEFQRNGVQAYGLCHEGHKDRALLETIAPRLGDFEIVSGLNGSELKGLIGTSRAIVAGRYHAIISALSQGVPAIMHGWSHKYRWLAEDYTAPELISDPYGARGAIESQIRSMLSDVTLKPRLESATQGVKSQSVAMWQQVKAVAAFTSQSNSSDR